MNASRHIANTTGHYLWMSVAVVALAGVLYVVTAFWPRADTASGVAGCPQADCCFAVSDTTAELYVGFAGPLDKIYIEAPFCRRASLRPGGHLSLAGNEVESIQLVLLAMRNLAGVSVRVAPVVPADATQTAADLDITIRRIAHVSQVVPKVAGSRIGWQPDPLLPVQPLELVRDRPLAFLVTVSASSQTPPGRYRTSLEIRAQDKLLATRPLQIDVWDFALPEQSRFRTASFPTYTIAEKLWPASLGYAPPDDAQRMARFLSLADLGFDNRLPPLGFIANGLDSRDRYGVSLTRLGFPLYGSDGLQPFDRGRADELLAYLQSRRASHFFIGFTSNIYKHDATAPQREQTLLRYLRDYHAYLEEKGLLDKVYVYNIDEPWNNAVDDAQRIYRLIKKHFGDDLRVMQNTNQNNDEIIGRLLGHFEVLDINLGFYDINALERYRREHPRALAEVWWNLNLWPDSHPNLFLEYPLIDARIIGPMSYRHDIQGFEYWHLAALYGIGNYRPLRATDRRIDWQVGENSLDGLLVYPHEEFGFYSSMRLESFRDGMEDLEYLYLLESLDPTHPELDVPVVSAIDEYETDPVTYSDYRRRLARAIESLRRGAAQ